MICGRRERMVPSDNHRFMNIPNSFDPRATSNWRAFLTNCRCDMTQKYEETRTLLQFHYTEWPCHTCPFSNAILEFRRRMRAVVGSRLQHDSPIVVHCKWVRRYANKQRNRWLWWCFRFVVFFFLTSDGGGRSGVYLSIDANLELAEEEDCYDVFGYLKTLRQSRKGMVETLVGRFAYQKRYRFANIFSMAVLAV